MEKLRVKAVRPLLKVCKSGGAYTVDLTASFHKGRNDVLIVLNVHGGGRVWTPFLWLGRSGPDAAFAASEAMRMSRSILESIDAGVIDSCWNDVSRRLS